MTEIMSNCSATQNALQDMDTDHLLLAFRFIERFAAVILGGISIYLGFKLFLHLPTQTNSEGKVILPGDVSIFLSRIGPGAFFALFGSVILVYSTTSKSQLSVGSSPPDSLPTAGVSNNLTYYYRYSGPNKTASNEDERTLIAMDLETLDELERRVSDMLEGKNAKRVIDNELAARLSAGIPRLRRHLIHSKWNSKWKGDPDVFVDWVERGDPDYVPEELIQPVDYFQLKRTTK